MLVYEALRKHRRGGLVLGMLNYAARKRLKAAGRRDLRRVIPGSNYAKIQVYKRASAQEIADYLVEEQAIAQGQNSGLAMGILIGMMLT